MITPYKVFMYTTYLTLVLLLSCLLHLYWHSTFQQDDVRNYLGTRTPYRFKFNKNDTNIMFSQCKEEKIWMVSRHGTRLPSAADIKGMHSTLSVLWQEILSQHSLNKGKLNENQIKRFRRWTNKLDAMHEKDLALEGQDEMLALAERTQNRFPDIVKDKYDINSFYFRYTATQRAQQSAKYFTIGLFDIKDAQNVIFAPALKLDPLLRFYKHCDKWQKEVKGNSSTYIQQRAFGKSKLMNDTLEQITKRLGLNNIISLDTVILMFKTCGYETSWNKYEDSPWCYAFDIEDAQRLEYYFDLKHYWMDGYGHELTYQQACLPMKTMFNNFSSNDGPNATFLFAHSGTLLKILAYLQLYRPKSPLIAERIQRSRLWKTTQIDCFGSNLAFVLYRCKNGPKVLTLHQEKIIKLPMCQEELCSLDYLKEYFYDSIYNCNMSDICNIL